MFNSLGNWLDTRTGYKALMHEALDEPIPGGARWRYVFGSALTSTFLIQFATGLLLMFSYSASSTTAWGSVYYINNVMTMGWFIRGIHHYGSQAMVVLLALHLMQVLVAGAYRAPREVNWWFGMVLLFLTLGLSLTGYLLPWDQKGYWATKVATNIAGGTPVVGPSVQRLLVGGTEYGNQTLTRFFGLHVGVLPTLLVLTLAGHVALFRKHGVTAPRHARGEGRFWPEQIFMDVVATVGVLGVLLYLVVSEGGVSLDAPADPSSSEYPARPEWYFLFLFQTLKYFEGDLVLVGTLVIPGVLVALLMLMPLFDKVLPRGLAHFTACTLVAGMIGGAAYLTYEAIRVDAANHTFQASRRKADVDRERALRLASDPGIGPDGASYLLLRDPLHHGKAVLQAKCLSCHYYDGKGQVAAGPDGKEAMSPQVAADLSHYGTRAWIRGLLENPSSDAYFGKVPQCGGMATWKKGSKLDARQLDLVADFVSSFAEVPEDQSAEEWAGTEAVTKHPGQELFVKDCGGCHIVGEAGLLGEGGQQPAPNLFAYGSDRWTRRMIKNPAAPDLYGYLEPHEQMPGFAGQLTDNDLRTVIRFLKDDYPGAPGPGGPAATGPEAAMPR